MKSLLPLFFLLILCCPINAQIELDEWDNSPIERLPYSIKSNDDKIRLFSTPISDERGFRYTHTIEYDVAPGKTRMTRLDDSRFFSFNATAYPELIINAIYHVHNNTYLLEGVSEDNYCLMGVDVGRGIAKDAYIFRDPETLEPICFISLCVNTTEYVIGEIKVEFSENRIQLPEWRYGCFWGIYTYQYFNGAHYSNSISYAEVAPKIEEGKEIVTGLHFKDADNRLKKTTYSPSESISVTVDIAAKGERSTKPLYLTLRNDEEDEHFQRKLVKVKIPLKPINGAAFIEGVNPFYFPVTSQRKFLRGKLRNVRYTAGRESAFPYEWLRYSAVIFNRPIEEKEWHRIRWALEVDGKLQLLEGENWQGPQIDLQMQDEWLNKNILVIPYIEGNPINRKMAIETSIIPYFDKKQEKLRY